MTEEDPFSLPSWHALSRECKLARQLVASGATALGAANYADRKGDYYVAFFGLSIGIERLAKLVLVADHALHHSGKLPSQRYVRGFGHELMKLMDAVSEVEQRNSLNLRFAKPNTEIELAVISCLDSFADARRGRYANYDALGDPQFGDEFEPLRIWWATVAEPILQKHFYGRSAEAGVRARAELIDAMMGGISLVRHTAEDGRPLTDVASASYQTGATAYVQKYGRYYSLRVVRWICDVFRRLCQTGAYERRIAVLFGHEEHFMTYTVDDEFLRTRKRWPL